MSDEVPQNQAVEELQQFGLREYEAKCFVSLTKISSGTARDVSKHIDIPRTRVYEAVRSLESAGLVEIQHSSPQQFRAISVSEAIEILNERHQARIASIEQSLRKIRSSGAGDNPQEPSEIWSLSDEDAITARTKRLVKDAETEILLLVGHDTACSESISRELINARDRGVDVVVGSGTQLLREQLLETLPESVVYEAALEWLQSAADPDAATVGRVLLVDDELLLASTIFRGEQHRERAVCGGGSCNGLIVVLRHLLARELKR